MGYESITGPNWIVPTAPVGDSSNRVADTAFVGAAISAGTTGFTLQTKYNDFTTFLVATSTMAGAADTIPQATDGTQIVTVAITPNATSNLLLIQSSAAVACTTGANLWMAVFQDAVATAVASIWFGNFTGNASNPRLVYQAAAGTTGPTTLAVRIGNLNGSNATFAVNGQALVGGRRLGGSQRAALTVTEVKA